MTSLKTACSPTQVRTIAIIWWFIWYARNQIIFRQDSIAPRALGLMIRAFICKLNGVDRKMGEVWCSKPTSSRPPRVSRSTITWDPPQKNFTKLNFDGSLLSNGSAAYGFVLRNEEGNLLLSGAGAIPPNLSILVAEAWGLREGIRGALFLGIKNLIIEGDNLSVIQAIKRVWKVPWSIHALISDAEIDLQKLESYSIHHVFREANFAADWMAHHGQSTSNLCYYFTSLDISFSQIIRKDALGWPVNWIPP